MSDQYEVHMRTREGRDLWVIIACSPVVDEFGEVAGMLGMLTDITERKQAEVALGRSEAEIRTMFESAAIGMALVDPTTRPVKCNPALEKFFACSAAELAQTTLLELTHSDDLLAVLEKKRLLDFGEYDSFHVESRLRQKAGQYAWARITMSQIRLPDGTTPNAVVMIEDIREGKRLEKEIHAAERLRALIFDSVGDVLYYIGVEGNGRFRFLSVNETFLRATGLRQEQVIGRFVDEVIPQPSLSLVVDKYERAILERRTQKWDEVSLYPSGTKYGEVTVTPLFDQDGRCTGLVGTVHDITERKYAEERIAAQAALLDHARDAILLRALDETVRYWNEGAARLYGWSAAEATGRKTTDLIYRDTGAFEEARSHLLAEGTWAGEITQFTKDGREVVIEGSWTLLRDSQGRPQSILAINTDVTEKKKLQAQISLAQRLEELGTLAGGIAHDFNNILTAVMGNLGLTQRNIPSDHPAQKNLAIASSACTRAEELVQRILTFSRRPENQRIPLLLQPVVEEALQLLRSTLPAMIDLHISWTPDTPAISADASQIHQIIMNLGTNASHAMGDHGTLSVRLEPVSLEIPLAGASTKLPPGRYAKLSVEDTGCGMNESTLARILEPFFTTKAPGRGTGLGLSVVHGIVKDHGGAIVVTSRPGAGTKFEIYFPAADIGAAAETALPLTEPPLGRGERILYVDDEASILALSKHILEGCGYRVTCFTDPVDALRAFQTTPHEFDAVLTDFAMPHVSGLELAESILRVRSAIPVVLMSGHLRPEDWQTAQRLGLREILRKPSSVGEMVYALGRLFGRPAKND